MIKILYIQKITLQVHFLFQIPRVVKFMNHILVLAKKKKRCHLVNLSKSPLYFKVRVLQSLCIYIYIYLYNSGDFHQWSQESALQ